MHRVEGAERILEDHRDLAAIPEQVLARAQTAQRPAAVVDLAAGRLIDPRQQAGDGALAAAALTHERDDLALVDRQVDVVDGVQCLLGQTSRRGGSAVSAPRLGAAACSACAGRGRLGLISASLGHRAATRLGRVAASVYSRQRTCASSTVVQLRLVARRRSASPPGSAAGNGSPLGGSARSGGDPGIPTSCRRGPVTDGNAFDQAAAVRMQRAARRSARWSPPRRPGRRT